jgi:hypothetical protein
MIHTPITVNRIGDVHNAFTETCGKRPSPESTDHAFNTALFTRTGGAIPELISTHNREPTTDSFCAARESL